MEGDKTNMSFREIGMDNWEEEEESYSSVNEYSYNKSILTFPIMNKADCH